MPAATRSKARFLIVAVVLVVAAAASASPLLRAAGRLLVVDDPVSSADVIVLPEWAGESGAIDAADLVRAGVSSRVAVLAPAARPADRELARRHIQYADHTARLVDLLGALGVRGVEVIPNTAEGTEAEGELLPSWCDERRVRSLVVISAPDHSRRVRRVLHRSLAGRSTAVAVRAARYSTFDPEDWWATRDGLRIGIIELEKLFLDVLRHPIS